MTTDDWIEPGLRRDRAITLAWDNGKTDYAFRLLPVRTMKMQLTKVSVTSDGTSWKVSPSTETTIAASTHALLAMTTPIPIGEA